MGNAKARGTYAERQSNPLGKQGNHTRPHAGRLFKVRRARTRAEINEVVAQRAAALNRRRADQIVKEFLAMIDAGEQLTAEQIAAMNEAQKVATA